MQRATAKGPRVFESSTSPTLASGIIRYSTSMHSFINKNDFLFVNIATVGPLLFVIYINDLYYATSLETRLFASTNAKHQKKWKIKLTVNSKVFAYGYQQINY